MPKSKPIPLSVRVSFKDNVAAEQLRTLAKYLNDARKFLDRMESFIQKANVEFDKIIESMNRMDELFDLKVEQNVEKKEKEEKIVK